MANLRPPIEVVQGGTGNTSATAYTPVCGGTTATGNFQSVAALGNAGDVLTSNGAGALPSFQPAVIGGDVSGPGLSVVGDIATWNNITGTLLADSGVSISTDGTLAANSDTLVSTQKAVKTYIDTGFMPYSGGTFTGTVTFPAGASGAVGYQWSGAGAGTGFYSTGANNLVLQAGGNDLFIYTAFNTAVYRPLIFYSAINLYFQEPAGDYNQDSNTCLVGMDTVGGARTVTLHATPDSGQWITIYDRNGNAAANNVTINGNGNNIDGAASTTISINYGAISMFFDGNNWKII